jgi:glutamate/tyrosine decarboxylase-like PLP-dependent enzyme
VFEPREIRRRGETVLRRACDLAVEHLRTLSERPVAERATLADLRQAFATELPSGGEDPLAVIEHLAGAAEPGLVASPGPRFFGFVIGGAVPASIAADWLVSAWDQNSGLYAAAPAVSVIEEVTAGWLLALLDLPPSASVGFVTGCQMANCTALAAARNEVLARAGWDVESDGLQGAPRLEVVVAEEAHATIFTSLRLLGLGRERARRVACDAQGRMVPAALAEALADLAGPTIVCAQAGNVNSGAFDPLEEVIDIAHRHGAWVHVDGAFGLWAAASPRYAGLLAGHRGADSWSTDAHKWPNVPYDCGVVIVADAAAHRRAMSVDASYLAKSASARDPLDWVPEFSRRGRSVPLYAALRSLGASGVREIVERCAEAARTAAELLAADARVEILNDVVLNQVLVGFGGSGEARQRLTDHVVRHVQRSGDCWVGGTRWRGEAALRFSVSNWSTTRADVERSVAAILRALDAAGTPPAGAAAP